MRLAIPEFNGRVSPVFDFCRRILVIDTAEDGRMGQFTVELAGPDLPGRAERLQKLKIEALLCGGISCELAGHVARKGVRVFPWISGEINEVLSAFLEGRLPDPGLMMPGCPRGRGPREDWPRGWGACRGGRTGRRWR